MVVMKPLCFTFHFSDAAEEKKKEELREQAKKELEQWHAQREKQLELRKKENR